MKTFLVILLGLILGTGYLIAPDVLIFIGSIALFIGSIWMVIASFGKSEPDTSAADDIKITNVEVKAWDTTDPDNPVEIPVNFEKE